MLQQHGSWLRFVKRKWHPLQLHCCKWKIDLSLANRKYLHKQCQVIEVELKGGSSRVNVQNDLFDVLLIMILIDIWHSCKHLLPFPSGCISSLMLIKWVWGNWILSKHVNHTLNLTTRCNCLLYRMHSTVVRCNQTIDVISDFRVLNINNQPQYNAVLGFGVGVLVGGFLNSSFDVSLFLYRSYVRYSERNFIMEYRISIIP